MGYIHIQRIKTRSNVLELRVLNMVTWFAGSELWTAVPLAERLNKELDDIPTMNDLLARHSYRFTADESNQTVDLHKTDSYGDNQRHVLRITFK